MWWWFVIAAAAPAAPAAPAGIDTVREPARAVLMTHCGTCHDGARAGSKPAALKVFDLRRPDFTSPMTLEQLAKVDSRLESMDGTPAERTTVAAFVTAELTRRQAPR